MMNTNDPEKQTPKMKLDTREWIGAGIVLAIIIGIVVVSGLRYTAPPSQTGSATSTAHARPAPVTAKELTSASVATSTAKTPPPPVSSAAIRSTSTHATTTTVSPSALNSLSAPQK